MKTAFLILTTLIGSAALAKTADECKKHVADRIGTFSICHYSGTTQYNGKTIINFTVNSCEQKSEGADWVCQVSQEPRPSSDCEMEIVLDSECYFNKSARITKDGREDM